FATAFARLTGRGTARQHAVLGRNPTAAQALHPRRYRFLDTGRTQHGGAARLDEHAAGRGTGITPLDLEGTNLVRLASVVAHGISAGGSEWNAETADSATKTGAGTIVAQLQPRCKGGCEEQSSFRRLAKVDDSRLAKPWHGRRLAVAHA